MDSTFPDVASRAVHAFARESGLTPALDLGELLAHGSVTVDTAILRFQQEPLADQTVGPGDAVARLAPVVIDILVAGAAARGRKVLAKGRPGLDRPDPMVEPFDPERGGREGKHEQRCERPAH